MASFAPIGDFTFFAAHSPYALAPPAIVITATKAPNTLINIIIIISKCFSIITNMYSKESTILCKKENDAASVPAGILNAYINVPENTPSISENTTCLVKRANAIAIIGGSIDKSPTLIDSTKNS